MFGFNQVISHTASDISRIDSFSFRMPTGLLHRQVDAGCRLYAPRGRPDSDGGREWAFLNRQQCPQDEARVQSVRWTKDVVANLLILELSH